MTKTTKVKKSTGSKRAIPLAQEAFINLFRTQDKLAAQAAEVIKPYGVSVQQFNVLRILRGAGPDGLACREIAARMITRVPDITRLLDRLQRVGLIARIRSNTDRRVVLVTIVDKGLNLLAKLDRPVRELHRRQFHQLNQRELATLNQVLDKIR